MLSGGGPSSIDHGLDRLDLASRHTVLAAVSGGGDSTALLVILHDHLRHLRHAPALLAVTVDHGLRQESAAEAIQVAALCATLDVRHRTLRWDGSKPATGLQAAAREARHRLLAEAAREAGADLVLTGHTADDQAETILMRGARADGGGLAGIAPATLVEGRVWFARPLLATRRQALRDFLRARGVGWIDDPSNENEVFERVRVRRRVDAMPDADFEMLIAEVRAAAQARIDLGRRAAMLIRAHARQVSPGLVAVGRALLGDTDREGARHAFGILIAATGGLEHLPERAARDALFETIKAGPAKGTLGRSVADARRDHVYVYRERRGGWTGRQPALAGTLWDGRFRIADDVPEGAMVAARGPDAGEAPEVGNAPQSLVRAALAAEPALSTPFAGEAFRRVPAPWARYLPAFDLEPARAVAELFGCEDISPPPWTGHNAAQTA